MGFTDKLQDMLAQGLEVSKDFVEKAGERAKDLGRMGVIKIEIMNLRSDAQKTAAQLGLLVYKAFGEKDEPFLSAAAEGVKPLVERLKNLNDDIETREAEYRKLGGNEEDLGK